MKRHLAIDEIKETLSRRTERYPYEYLEGMKRRIESSEDSVWFALIPVTLVSCSQECFRQIYADIINSNKFLCNLKSCKCLKNANLNFEEIEKVKVDEITLGEYLSCYFSHNDINDVKNNLESLLNINFYSELRKFWEEEDAYSGKDFDKCLSILSRMYHLRHQICHEGICNVPFTKEEMLLMVDATSDFLFSSLYVVVDYYDDEAKLCTPELAWFVEKQYNGKNEELNDLIEMLEDTTANDDFPLKFDYMDAWKYYRENRAQADSSPYIDTTGFSYRYWSSMLNTTNDMVRNLKKQYHWI